VTLNDRLAQGSSDQQNIPVPISYEIIKHFSEGLYQSPHKAIEELVANSYDAGADHVAVIVPQDAHGVLWVLDDGCGMDENGFRQLWRVGTSTKSRLEKETRHQRNLIGQFGIGKLAAFVLAWRLTHISKSEDGRFRYTSMNFRDVEGRLLNDDQKYNPMEIRLCIVPEETARSVLQEIKKADRKMWDRLFGADAAKTWTVAALEDFKDLFRKLSKGRLGWVLSTGLPIVSNFNIRMNGSLLKSPKIEMPKLWSMTIGHAEDAAADDLALKRFGDGVKIPGLGLVTGRAAIYENRLTEGKSDRYNRSNGFFVRVRGRVINLDDELFGLPAQNHAVWSRFEMTIEAEDLQEHLLSSREGVRESEAIAYLRKYMHKCFNLGRSHYEHLVKDDVVQIDLDSILNKAPPSLIADPLADVIQEAVSAEGDALFYIRVPDNLTDVWLKEMPKLLRKQAFARFEMVEREPWGKMCEYDAKTRTLYVNKEHPYIASLLENSKKSNNKSAQLVAASEVITEALLRTKMIPAHKVDSLFRQRDRMFRRLAGELGGMDVPTVIRHLSIANMNKNAMEQAVGRAFELLGLKYSPRGGSGKPDGVLHASIAPWDDKDRSFNVVYDAKTSERSAVPANHVILQRIVDWMKDENARYGLVVGKKFEGEDSKSGSLNRQINNLVKDDKHLVTALRTDDLVELLKLHYRFVVPFDELRDLFENAHTLPDTRQWVADLSLKLEQEDRPSIRLLLEALEAQQSDPLDPVNVTAARAKNEELNKYRSSDLTTALKAVSNLVGERLLVVDDNGVVRMDQSAKHIVDEFYNRLAALEDEDIGSGPAASDT